MQGLCSIGFKIPKGMVEIEEYVFIEFQGQGVRITKIYEFTNEKKLTFA